MRTYPNKFGRLLLRDGQYGLDLHGRCVIRVPGHDAEFIEPQRVVRHNGDEEFSVTSGSGLILDRGEWRLR
jgi:hypothetical protein